MLLPYKSNAGTRVTPVTDDALLDKLRAKRSEILGKLKKSVHLLLISNIVTMENEQ